MNRILLEKYILMLEDDEQDREMSRGFFEAKSIPFHFERKSDGILNFLQEKIRNKELLPTVIILSLHSFPDSGLTVLQKIRSTSALKHLPVVILGENTLPEMCLACYREGASSFINKPFTDAETVVKINVFLDYWFKVVESPGRIAEFV